MIIHGLVHMLHTENKMSPSDFHYDLNYPVHIPKYCHLEVQTIRTWPCIQHRTHPMKHTYVLICFISRSCHLYISQIQTNTGMSKHNCLMLITIQMSYQAWDSLSYLPFTFPEEALVIHSKIIWHTDKWECTIISLQNIVNTISQKVLNIELWL